MPYAKDFGDHPVTIDQFVEWAPDKRLARCQLIEDAAEKAGGKRKPPAESSVRRSASSWQTRRDR